MKYIDAEKLKEEIERRRKFHDDAVIKLCNNRTIALTHSAGLKEDEELIKLIESLKQEEPDKSLEEAAEKKYPVYWKNYPKDGIARSELSYDTNKQCRDAFIAGAEWQKEQDQPITGNSLEQEWLRYVDKKKKEYGGELPSLGDYGWLQIARHFAEWQKQQMLKDAVEGEIHLIGFNNAIFIKEPRAEILDCYNVGDRVRIVILKAEG